MANLFIDVLRSYVRANEFVVHDFVVMPNHVHVMMTVPPDVTIEKAIQLIKGNFSFRAGKELGLRGEIWQRGFSEERITSKQSFQEHRKYIDNNPVKAKLVDLPCQFMFGSEYLKMQKRARATRAQEAAFVGRSHRSGAKAPGWVLRPKRHE